MLLTDFFETLALAGVLALIAVVYRYILLGEPVLHWFLRFGERYEKRWFFAPIWGCHKCIAGQLALWVYLFTHLNWQYSLVCHIFAICAAILIADLLKNKIIDKL